MSARELPEVPKTVAELSPAIQALVDGVTDPKVAYGPNTDGYGKCVEAMARAAYIAHERVADELGVTGFQHSMSSLSIVGMLRRIEGPYMIVDSHDLLYPQYDKVRDIEKWIDSDEMRTWLADEAQKKLDADLQHVHGAVIDHWRALVADRPKAVS